MPLDELIAFLDAYKKHNEKDKILLDRITIPLVDRAKTIQAL